MNPIYLDHNATSTPWPEVVEAMYSAWQQGYVNPASQHELGRQARRRLEDAREEMAALLGANLHQVRPDQLLLTSGGTEANNLALFGLTKAFTQRQPGRVIISAIEHPSVLSAAERLEQLGWEVVRLGVSEQGVVDPSELDALLEDAPTQLVSVMLANNETGVVQPLAEISTVCQRHHVLLHCDATQAAGKMPLNFQALGLAAMTFSAHKFQGPQGIGGLLLRSGVSLENQFVGGFQQAGLRPGTEPVPPAIGMLTALKLWQQRREELSQQIATCRDRFEDALKTGWEFPAPLAINGSQAERLPQTSNVGFVGMDRQALQMAFDMAGLACSTGSACSSGSSEPSHVLLAMGLPEAVVRSSLRFSFGPQNTASEAEEAAQRILRCCAFQKQRLVAR